MGLTNIIGQKGYGEDGFVRPTFCSYDKVDNKFAVMDFGLKKIFIYDRIGRIYFKRVKEIACWRRGTDIELSGDKLFISGLAIDENKRFDEA